MRHESKVDLTAYPVEVVRSAEPVLAGIEEHRRGEQSVLPVEIELDVAGGIPVEADIDDGSGARPLVGVRQPRCEYRVTQAQSAVATEQFDGTGAAAIADQWIERPQRDHRGPALHGFPGNEVSQRQVTSIDGNTGDPGVGPGITEPTQRRLALQRE